jgi:hypothetical protein
MSELIPGGGESFDISGEFRVVHSDILNALNDFDEQRNGMYDSLAVMMAEPGQVDALGTSVYGRADETMRAFGDYVAAALNDPDREAIKKDIARLWLQDDNERNRLFLELFKESEGEFDLLDEARSQEMVETILANAESNEHAAAMAKTMYGAILGNELGVFMRLWANLHQVEKIALSRCDHAECGFENRQEYCIITASEPDGGAIVVADMLDELLEESGLVQSDNAAYISEPEGSIFTRSFSHLDGDFQSWIWPPTERRLAICHEFDRKLNRDSYHVAVGWIIHRAGITHNAFNTTYTIDIYPQGRVQAVVEQPSLEQEGEFESRAMTDYDYETLFDELAIVHGLHKAEDRENRLVAERKRE